MAKGIRKGPRDERAPEADRDGPPLADVWSVRVAVEDLPDEGRHVELQPDAATREAIARAAGVLALPRMQAVYDLAPVAGDGVRVSGTVSATVEQTCVVSLEPVVSEIEEPIDLVLVPADSASAGARPNPDADQADPPEPLQGGGVDLGALAVEFLVLGIDPYPRKPGVVFDPPGAGTGAAEHPFAALAALKPDPGSKSS